MGQEDLLEEETATLSSILPWKILCTEELGGLQSMGSQRVGHDLVTEQGATNENPADQRQKYSKKRCFLRV